MDPIYQQLKSFGAVKINAPMSKHTTFRIGGPARFLVTVTETEKLVGLLNYLSGEGIAYFVLGGGSNILWKDEEFDGVIIKVTSYKLQVTNSTIIADSGVALALVVNAAMENALGGIEWGAGIPGTVGGAVRGNAGAYGGDAGQNIDKVEVWRDGEVVVLNNEECGFVYRGSGFKNKPGIILRAHFKLTSGDKAEIVKKTQGYIAERRGKFPPLPSAGSFFKNITIDKFPGDRAILPEKFVHVGKISAAWLIEQCGMKGFAHGGAKISEKHANFLVNWNNSTQSDVLYVVEKVKEAVYNKFEVELESEVEIVK